MERPSAANVFRKRPTAGAAAAASASPATYQQQAMAQHPHHAAAAMAANPMPAYPSGGGGGHGGGYDRGGGGGGGGGRSTKSKSSSSSLAFTICGGLLLLVALVAGFGWFSVQSELNEWRALREKKAAKRAAADAAAAAKKTVEEENRRRRAEASDAEVARVLSCPAVVTEEATRLAAEAKSRGEPRPRKDHSALHRCVLNLGGGSGGGGGSGSESGTGSGRPCEVCVDFLSPLADALKVDLAGAGKNKDQIADRALGTGCAAAEERGNARHSKLCDSLLASRREVTRPLALGVPVQKICERASARDPLVCELRFAKEGTVGDDGESDAAAGDAFKRLSLLVHPDKHEGKNSGKAASAFRMLKTARDHFDKIAKKAAEKRAKEEGR